MSLSEEPLQEVLGTASGEQVVVCYRGCEHVVRKAGPVGFKAKLH